MREALRVLELHGLLHRTKAGTFVQANFSKIIEESITLEILVSNAQFDDIQATRVMLERELIRLATNNRTAENLANFQFFIKQMEDALESKDINAFNDADIAFHNEVALAANNSVLLFLYSSISDLIFKVHKKVSVDKDAFQASILFHKSLYQAILNQDVLKAEEHLIGHLNDVGKRILRLKEINEILGQDFHEKG